MWESEFMVAMKERDREWLGKRDRCHSASIAAVRALQMVEDPKAAWATVLHRRWELTRVVKGDAFPAVVDRINTAMAELPADGQKAPRGKRKLEVYEILKDTLARAYVDDADGWALDLMTRLRPYLK